MVEGIFNLILETVLSKNEGRNGPYGQLENAVEVPRECRYCWKRACPKGLDCLAKITPEMIEEKLAGYL